MDSPGVISSLFERLGFIDAQPESPKPFPSDQWKSGGIPPPGSIKEVRSTPRPDRPPQSNTQPAKKASISSSEVADSPKNIRSPKTTDALSRETRSDSQNLVNPKLRKFQVVLEESNPDLQAIRALCWNGIPFEYRPIYWQLLLGYLPTLKDRREATLNDKRKKYWESVKQFWDVDPLDRSENEKETLIQILKDVNRTFADFPFFQLEETRLTLTRILYIWSIRHPASGYVQGINDLVIPFMCTFLSPSVEGEVLQVSQPPAAQAMLDMEADVYWCLTKFISCIQDNFTPIQPGIQRMIYKLKELTQRLDAPLHKHFEEQKLEYFQFSFRWMNCLLTRELPIKLVTRIWDTYLSEGEAFASLHVYFCVAFLKHFSPELIAMDFSGLMKYLQGLPTSHWEFEQVEVLLSQAYVWRNAYQDSKHLQSS